MPDRNIKSTATILRQILKKYNLENDLFHQIIFDSWREIVGHKLAKICEPVELDRGKLVLKVKNEIWRQELGKKRKELLNSIKTKTNVNKINSIEFI